MLIHGVTKYQCDKCDYKAIQKGNLKVHEMLIHESIKYQCNECDYKTAWKHLVKEHKFVRVVDLTGQLLFWPRH